MRAQTRASSRDSSRRRAWATSRVSPPPTPPPCPSLYHHCHHPTHHHLERHHHHSASPTRAYRAPQSSQSSSQSSQLASVAYPNPNLPTRRSRDHHHHHPSPSHSPHLLHPNDSRQRVFHHPRSTPRQRVFHHPRSTPRPRLRRQPWPTPTCPARRAQTHTYIYINTMSRPIALDTLHTHVTTAHVTIHTSQYDAKALQNPLARGVVIHDEFLRTTRAATTARHRRARFYARTNSIARYPRTPIADRARAARHAVVECEVRGKRPLTRRLARARRRRVSRRVVARRVRARSGKGGKEITQRGRGGVPPSSSSSSSVRAPRTVARRVTASRRGAAGRDEWWLRHILMEFYLYIRVDGGHDGCHGFVLYRTMCAIL